MFLITFEKTYCLKYLFFLLLSTNFLVSSAAIVLPGDSISIKPPSQQYFSKATKAAVTVPTLGLKKKNHFFQKIRNRIAQQKWASSFASDRGEPTEKQKKLGKLSMIFGISSFALLFIPYVGILSIPAAIAALVLGLKSIKGNSNTQGLIGVITGSAVLFIIAIAIVVILSGGYWF